MVNVLTFIGRVEGLDAPSLHAQYFEEYLMLSRYVDHLFVVSDTVASRRFDLPPNMEIVKVPALRVPKLYGATKIVFYSLTPVLKGGDVDVVYVRTFSPPELSAIWMGKQLAGIPSVLVLPGTWLFGDPMQAKGKERFYRWFLRRALDACEKVVLYSRLMLPEVLLYHRKLDVSKVIYIHNAVNVDRFNPWGDRSQRLETLKRGRRCVLYVGRVNEKKGVGDLVQAFEIVSAKYSDCVLAIAGSGEAGYMSRLAKMVEKPGLADSVFFLGPVPNREMPMLFRSADVVAYATREGEGIPRALLEGMACGRPAVATRVAGIPEAVVDGFTGFVVEPRDIAALADRLHKLLTDDSLRKEMGVNARQHVEKEFSYAVIVPKIARVLDEVGKRRA
ncbi:MAG: glycosyltransferase family 4 protein [Candidatus Caldarchaeum sp.]|jgi:glycosyltransferase involved in cell wall biosynthesis